mgnify:CR=1 FL=1
MVTLNNSMELTGAEKLTLFPVDFHASHTVAQGLEKEQKMNAIYGRKCLGLFERLPQNGLWVKTFSVLLLGRTDWYSSRCILIWRLRATKYKRLYFLLQVRTRLIDGTEHGLLHTPRSILATMKISLKDRPDHIRYRKKDLMEIPNLNPRYLEWMMGYPDGWTKLEDSETP